MRCLCLGGEIGSTNSYRRLSLHYIYKTACVYRYTYYMSNIALTPTPRCTTLPSVVQYLSSSSALDFIDCNCEVHVHLISLDVLRRDIATSSNHVEKLLR